MLKYTKGEWEALYTIVIGPDSETIADCSPNNTTVNKDELDRETRKANAKLIAASPNMYEALKVAKKFIAELNDNERELSDKENEYYKMICAAIAKAEGKYHV